MIAILGGLASASLFATATVAASRGARLIGAGSFVAGVMAVGLAIALPLTAAGGRPTGLGAHALGWLALSGGGNVAGLLLDYAALRLGKLGLVAPILATEGAIAALISVAAGEPLAPGAGATLVLIALGVSLAARADRGEPPSATERRVPAVLLALAAAACFGVSLYATGRVSAELPLAWALLPARLVGVAAVALPLALTRRLRMTRRALPWVVIAGGCEVGGFAAFALGARHGLAISAVISSQFATLAALAGLVLFRERLARVQLVGVAAVAVGVAIISSLQG
jgi:drug/metabolite transporter (DMT)-like permease